MPAGFQREKGERPPDVVVDESCFPTGGPPPRTGGEVVAEKRFGSGSDAPPEKGAGDGVSLGLLGSNRGGTGG